MKKLVQIDTSKPLPPLRANEIHRYIMAGSDNSSLTVEYMWLKGFTPSGIIVSVARFDCDALDRADARAIRAANSWLSLLINKIGNL